MGIERQTRDDIMLRLTAKRRYRLGSDHDVGGRGCVVGFCPTCMGRLANMSGHSVTRSRFDLAVAASQRC